LRDILDVGALKDQFILLRLRLVYSYTLQHLHVSYNLLAQEITDFQSRAIVLDDTVDREMGIHCPHFVLEALRNTLDHIRDETPDRPQAGNVLPATLPDGESNFGRVIGFHQPNVHVDVSDILDEGTSWPLDGDDTGLDGNVDTLRDLEFFC